MRMRAYATGQYINDGFGMFVGLRESRYLQLPQVFIAPHNLRGYCLSDIHLLNLLICRLAVGSCGTIAHHHQYNKEFFQFTGLSARFPDIVGIDESKGFLMQVGDYPARRVAIVK